MTRSIDVDGMPTIIRMSLLDDAIVSRTHNLQQMDITMLYKIMSAVGLLYNVCVLLCKYAV